MARVTVEDCVLLVPNRFELVMVAAHRARALSSGAELTIDRDRDKNPVVALREIADHKLDLDSLNESLIKSLQKRIEPDRPEDEAAIELMDSEQQSWISAGTSLDDLEDDDGETDLDMEEEEGAEGDMTLSGDERYEDVEIKD